MEVAPTKGLCSTQPGRVPCRSGQCSCADSESGEESVGHFRVRKIETRRLVSINNPPSLLLTLPFEKNRDRWQPSILITEVLDVHNSDSPGTAVAWKARERGGEDWVGGWLIM